MCTWVFGWRVWSLGRSVYYCIYCVCEHHQILLFFAPLSVPFDFLCVVVPFLCHSLTASSHSHTALSFYQLFFLSRSFSLSVSLKFIHLSLPTSPFFFVFHFDVQLKSQRTSYEYTNKARVLLYSSFIYVSIIFFLCCFVFILFRIVVCCELEWCYWNREKEREKKKRVSNNTLQWSMHTLAQRKIVAKDKTNNRKYEQLEKAIFSYWFLRFNYYLNWNERKYTHFISIGKSDEKPFSHWLITLKINFSFTLCVYRFVFTLLNFHRFSIVCWSLFNRTKKTHKWKNTHRHELVWAFIKSMCFCPAIISFDANIPTSIIFFSLSISWLVVCLFVFNSGQFVLSFSFR